MSSMVYDMDIDVAYIYNFVESEAHSNQIFHEIVFFWLTRALPSTLSLDFFSNSSLPLLIIFTVHKKLYLPIYSHHVRQSH